MDTILLWLFLTHIPYYVFCAIGLWYMYSFRKKIESFRRDL